MSDTYDLLKIIKNKKVCSHADIQYEDGKDWDTDSKITMNTRTRKDQIRLQLLICNNSVYRVLFFLSQNSVLNNLSNAKGSVTVKACWYYAVIR